MGRLWWNRVCMRDAFSVPFILSWLYPSRVFVYVKHVYNRNQPQPSRENVRRPRTDRYSDRKAQSLDVLQFHHRVTVWNCVIIYHFTDIGQERPNERYRNTVKDLLLPNTVSQKDGKPHTAGLDDTAIPHIKIKITEIYRLKESSIPQYRKLTPMSPSVREKWVEVWDTGYLKTALYHTLAFRAFSLTWPASMLIYWNKRKFLHKKRV